MLLKSAIPDASRHGGGTESEAGRNQMAGQRPQNGAAPASQQPSKPPSPPSLPSPPSPPFTCGDTESEAGGNQMAVNPASAISVA